MNTKLGLLLLGGFALVVSSCAKSKDDEPAPAFTPDNQRAIGEPRFSFQAEQQEIKLKSLNASEISEMLACGEKSTAHRTEKKKFSVGYGFIQRAVANGKKTVRSEKMDFVTENREEVYELTTSLNEYIISDRNVLENGVISYRDFCSSSAGCDQEKRKFLTGSSTYLISTKLKEEAIVEEVRREKGMTECFLKSVTEETEHVQKGQIRIGENSFKAIQYVEKESGKVYCRAGSSREAYFLGEGVQIKKSVMLLDQLMMSSKVGQLHTASSYSLGACQRTAVFASSEIQFEGNSIIGESFELADYSFSGETMSLEDWNKKKSGIKARVADLKNEVVIKKSNHDRVQLNLTESEDALKTAEAKVADLKVKLNEAIAGKKPDEDVIRGLVKAAEESVESARARRDSSKNLHVIAQTQVKDAEEALNAYIKENGTGEN